MKIFGKMVKEGLRKIEVRPNLVPIPEAEWLAEVMKKEGHKKAYLFCHPEVKLKAVIGIHSQAISPKTLGGIRMFDYSDEREAFLDVIRLSRAMTYKSAMAGVEKGGAKCVIWGDPKEEKTDRLLEVLAGEIENLKGEYVGGEDMNISEKDVLLMKKVTSFVVGLPENFRQGKLIGSGNPSPITAQGVVLGMKACLNFLNMGSLEGKTVAIQGFGAVGCSLAGFLIQEGVKQIIATDIDPGKIAHFREEFKEKARLVDSEDIFSQKCDIFAPCARGGVLNKETIPLLKCKIVAGAANNQLQNHSDGKRLIKQGILYAPDYVINAGGLINVEDELYPDGYDRLRVQKKLENISRNLLKVFWYSQRLNMPTDLIADMLAEEKIWITQVSR